MIPILYDTNEDSFISNGLGRLRDAISVIVTEERNGIYECDFEYPVNGAHYDEIQIGRIVGVTHDESEDIQPFDIVSFTRPIDGIVTFHCVHISYRQSYMTVTGSNINSLADAFAELRNAQPSNPFSYTTDKTSTGYVAAFDGVPKSVRSVLGGVEGSILDAYGGEYEWDKFNVILHSARGQLRNFSIRYGVNMLDYEEEYDSSGTYSSCIPYWTDGTTTIVGDRQDSSGSTVTGRGECVPLDVSEKFESQPTKAQVEAMGLSVMNANNPMIPKQNIHVEFVRLQDMGYEWLDSLYECKLCDTVTVVFPDYDASGQFKIVKTVWNVLEDRFESMELGDLSVTLAEALGISSTSRTSNNEYIGEVKRAEPSAAVSVPNNTWKALCSISLEAGTWIVVCTVRAPSNATGYRSANLGTSGQSAINACVAAASGNVTQFDFTKVVSPTVQTTYYLNVWQNSGTALSYSTGSTNYITAIRIR